MKYYREATKEKVDVRQWTGSQNGLDDIAGELKLSYQIEMTGAHVRLNAEDAPQVLQKDDYIFVSELDGLHVLTEQDFDDMRKKEFLTPVDFAKKHGIV